MKERIKLVIWDLDDTLWNGTVSEGKVSERTEMTDLLKHLARRGVISAVCSKNDEKTALKQLEDFGLSDFIVLTSISWESKAARIQDIISTLQLRVPNVLFVDDNVFNLQEVKYVLPDIQVVQVDKLLLSIALGDLCFEEKHDDALTRLAQYRLIVNKKDQKRSFASNQEFLEYSDIRVELLEGDTAWTERVFELIHRTNQLNFTKDRITREQVEGLLLDSTVRSGCISVRDRFGDYGIVGFFAVRNAKLEQFVFSCRILNMGVEQWVYAQLGYPSIEIKEPVASSLSFEPAPSWINASKNDLVETPHQREQRLVAYGSCPLRPIWAYLQPVFPNSYFAEIDPEPSICNLAIAARESQEYLDFVLSHVRTFDKRYTFDKSIFTNNIDFLLLSLDSALDFYRYFNGTHAFYSKKLLADTLDGMMLSGYMEQPITCEDVTASLETISDSLKDADLLILNNPETVFPTKGRDSDYRKRVKLNRLVQELSMQRDNIRIIDIMRYTESPTDFYDTYAGHFNRSVAYRIAQDITRIISAGNMDATSIRFHEMQPLEKVEHVQFPQDMEIKTAIVIENGVLTLSIDIPARSMALDGCTFDYDIFCGNVREASIKETSMKSVQIRCTRPGVYRAVVRIRSAEGLECQCESKPIQYSEYNYHRYEKPDKEGYTAHLEDLNQFCSDNALYDELKNEYICDIVRLLAAGVSLATYFLNRNINQVSVFTDSTMGNVIIPLLQRSDLDVRHIYSIDADGYFNCDGGITIALVDDVNAIAVEPGDHVFFASSGRQFEKWTTLFLRMGAELHTISYVLSVLKTQTFFVHEVNARNLPRVICVRSPHLSPFNSFPYTSVLPSEKVPRRIDVPVPRFQLDPHRLIRSFQDTQEASYMIRDGVRQTANQPREAPANIYVFGDSYVFGYGVSDNETIPSQLQRLCGDAYRVHNKSNIWQMTDCDHMVRSMLLGTYEEHDIIVIYLTNWMNKVTERRWHWLNWEACVATSGIETIDGFPLFMEPNRDEYFLAKGAYTVAGNHAMAKLVWDYVSGSSNER